jgi:hypothetical protein
VVYSAALALCVVGLALAARHLLWSGASIERIVLPLGIPWIGAHFRLDALSAFFVAVVNLGAAAASLYGLGYGRHEHAPERVLPFYPAVPRGMNLVLWPTTPSRSCLSWEFMSLAVLGAGDAHHRDRGNCPRGLRLSHDGELRHAGPAARLRPAWRAPDGAYDFDSIRAGTPTPLSTALGARPDAARRRVEGRPGAAPRLAAARPSGRPQPRLGADERRHDQGRGLRLRARRPRPARAEPAWWWGLVVHRARGVTARVSASCSP